MTKSFFRAAHGIFVVYSITSDESYKNVTNWIKIALENKPTLPVAVIGNKCDLESERVVQRSLAESMCAEKGMDFAETSATQGDGVQEVFRRFAERAYGMKSTNDPPKKDPALGKTLKVEAPANSAPKPKSSCLV